MLDLQIKFAFAAALAWLVTRRVTPGNAAAAHRLWFAVILAPVAWAIGRLLVAPVAYARLEPGTVADVLSASMPEAGWTPAIVYGAIACLLLGRIVHGVWAVHRLIRASHPVAIEELQGEAIGIPRSIGIREGSLALPVTAGFLRPVVLLPADWRRYSPAALEVVLRHEAAHARRRDPLIALACAVVEAVLWCNPAVWMAARQVRWFAEMACDADAAKGMHERTYAAELLSLAAGWRGSAGPRYAITAGADTDVGRRIRLLLDELDAGWRRRLAIPLVTAAVLVLLPLAATLRLEAVPARGWMSSLDDHAPMHAHAHQHP